MKICFKESYVIFLLFWHDSGMWAIGLASLRCDLNMVPLGKDQYSWVLRSDGALMHNNIAIDNIQLTVSEGDYLVSCQYSSVLV